MDGDGQSIKLIRQRAASAGVSVHESAGAVILSAPSPIPPGLDLCHFGIHGDAVSSPQLIRD